MRHADGPTTIRSKIYRGQVMHARLHPVRHEFTYPVYWYEFDLAELETIAAKMPWLFGYNKIRPIAIFDEDYLLPGPGSIRQKLERYLQEMGVAGQVARVTLHTGARYFNYVFNSVSFFYCLDAQDNVVAIVAEVNNTFGERHLYLLATPTNVHSSSGMLEYRNQKEFHVSPFNDMQGTYHFYFSPSGAAMFDAKINIERAESPAPVFVSRMWGSARPLTASNLVKTIACYPIRAWLQIPRIYWQALRLHFQRGLPVIPKPPPSSPHTIIPGASNLT